MRGRLVIACFAAIGAPHAAAEAGSTIAAQDLRPSGSVRSAARPFSLAARGEQAPATSRPPAARIESCRAASRQAGPLVFTLLEQIVVLVPPRAFARTSTFFDNSRSTMVIETVPCDQTQGGWRDFFSLTVGKNMGRDPAWTTEGGMKETVRHWQAVCPSDAFIYQPVRAVRVDSYDATGSIIGCANFPSDLPTGEKRGEGEVGYMLIIKGESDALYLWRAKRQRAFDPAQAPITAARLPDMGTLKLCEAMASRRETAERCMQRPVRP